MIPNPYNNAGLIMQGFGQLGQGVAQGGELYRAEQKANAPIDPQLEAFARGRLDQAMKRMEAGADPVGEARQYQEDLRRAIQQFQSTAKPGQVQVPNVVPQVTGPSGPIPSQRSMGQIAAGGPAPQQLAPQPVVRSVPLPAQTDLAGARVQPDSTGQPLMAPPPSQSQPQMPQPQPQTQRPQGQRINQLASPPPAPRPRMTQRQFEQFQTLGQQLNSMDQVDIVRQSGQNKLAAAEINSAAKLYTRQLQESGLDARQSAALATAAARTEATLGVKVFDIMQRMRMMRAQIESREGIARMNAASRINMVKEAREMTQRALDALNRAESEGNEEAKAVARPMVQAGQQLLEALGAIDLEEEVVPGTPPQEGLIFDTPGTPDTTRTVARPPPNPQGLPTMPPPTQRPVPRPAPKQPAKPSKGKSRAAALGLD